MCHILFSNSLRFFLFYFFFVELFFSFLLNLLFCLYRVCMRFPAFVYTNSIIFHSSYKIPGQSVLCWMCFLWEMNPYSQFSNDLERIKQFFIHPDFIPRKKNIAEMYKFWDCQGLVHRNGQTINDIELIPVSYQYENENPPSTRDRKVSLGWLVQNQIKIYHFTSISFHKYALIASHTKINIKTNIFFSFSLFLYFPPTSVLSTPLVVLPFKTLSTYTLFLFFFQIQINKKPLESPMQIHLHNNSYFPQPTPFFLHFKNWISKTTKIKTKQQQISVF